MSEEPFYVGYLPLPRSLRRPVVLIVLALFFADAALALVAVRGMKGHASGAWGTFGEARVEGRFRSHPYPLLQVAGDNGIRTVLLVGEYKHGAGRDDVLPDGSLAAAYGYPIYRGDLTVLQLDRDVEPLAGAPLAIGSAAEPIRTTLDGEIVDAKCWAGAMNPGEGKAHKGCGSLCLLGDIPALFIGTGPDGTPHWYLMAAPGGGAVREEARALVGEHLTLTGSVVRTQGLSIFTPDALP
ncbi:MAG TPA: hypothetical protein VKS60_00545 [Stellaceae bacterium]|nr:hypothetical protein [Stellaceae bacterium]